MADDGNLVERVLSAGYKKSYELADWTVFTKGERFFAIEAGIDAATKMTGSYSELVAGRYEQVGVLLGDLEKIREDDERIARQAGRENLVLVAAALLLTLANIYRESVTRGLESSSLLYLLAWGVVVFLIASFFSSIRGYQIRRAITGAWPDRIKRYSFRGSALRELGAEMREEV